MARAPAQVRRTQNADTPANSLQRHVGRHVASLLGALLLATGVPLNAETIALSELDLTHLHVAGWSPPRVDLSFNGKSLSIAGEKFAHGIGTRATTTVWFELDGGMGHIVEDERRWPRGDLFAREVLGGMLDVDIEVQKRQGRWVKGDRRVEGWRKGWRK